MQFLFYHVYSKLLQQQIAAVEHATANPAAVGPLHLAPPPLAPYAAGHAAAGLCWPPLAPADADPSTSGICPGRAAANSTADGTPARWS